MPGLLDIHTHLDLEVELAPGLPESVRHGTTTVVVGNCSLGTAFGAQRRNGEDPILDCFTRVENIPKPVLRKVVDRIDWDTTAGYLEHLDRLPLGPNMVPLIPHSMLRIEVMGTAAAVSREPTDDELLRMARLLEDAMQQGYAGFSTDAIPFHYLANAPHTDKRIPAQHATLGELRTLLEVVRGHDRVWQCTPDASNRVATFLRFFLTSGRLFGRPLKTSALTAVDLTHERRTWKLFPLIANLLNSPLVNGRFHFQVLATPFRMYAEGAICPIFEEFESSRQLMACDIEDAAARRRIMASDAFGDDCSCANGTTPARSPPSTAISTPYGRALPGAGMAGRDFRGHLSPAADFQSGRRRRGAQPRGSGGTRLVPEPDRPRGRVPAAPRAPLRPRPALVVHRRQRPPRGAGAAAFPPAHAAGLQRQRRAPDQPGVLRRQPAHAAGRPATIRSSASPMPSSG